MPLCLGVGGELEGGEGVDRGVQVPQVRRGHNLLQEHHVRLEETSSVKSGA